MKVDRKSIETGTGLAQKKVTQINFNDRAIDKLFIKTGNRINIKFQNISVSYLTGLNLLYSPKTQKKKFYLKYYYKSKTHWLKLSEFIYGHYGTLEVSAELLKLYKKYHKEGRWKHDPQEQLITQRELEQRRKDLRDNEDTLRNTRSNTLGNNFKHYGGMLTANELHRAAYTATNRGSTKHKKGPYEI